ncbi:MAG: hypothetical protein Q4A01_09160 [Coriobacteriales bacterium]|nr:hypothetical protein [Coriobacteriales bacterium]
MIWGVSGTGEVQLLDASGNLVPTDGTATGVLAVSVKGVKAGPVTITCTSNDNAEAKATCALTVSAATHKVTPAASPAEGGTATADPGEAAEGAAVTLTATPADGYEFDRWVIEGDGAKLDNADSATTKLTMGAANVTATANFKKKEVAVPDASVTAHVQRIGWMDPVIDGTAAGTTGKSRRMEALTLRLPDGVSGGIEYRGHVQRSGWEKDWKADGAESGTTGKSRRMEAVQIQLTGAAKDAYDVYYRVDVQRYGWMGWAKNGEEAGTQGMSRRAEAIQVVLVKKDAPAPDATYKGVTQQYDKAFVKK